MAKTYEDGLIEGELKALAEMTVKHGDRLDSHSRRLRLLEKIIWASGGVVVFLQVWPTVAKVMQNPPV